MKSATTSLGCFEASTTAMPYGYPGSVPPSRHRGGLSPHCVLCLCWRGFLQLLKRPINGAGGGGSLRIVLMEELTLTPAQEFREARDWLARHKRDPFLWLIILLPLIYAVHTVVVPAILMTVFPFSEAKRALGQDLPSADIIRVTTLCKLRRGTYLFGYDLRKNKIRIGRVCRDVVRGGWILEKGGTDE